jgi:hypothetical protein
MQNKLKAKDFYSTIILDTNCKDYRRYEVKTKYPYCLDLNLIIEMFPEDRIRMLFSEIKWEIKFESDFNMTEYTRASILDYIPYEDIDKYVSYFAGLFKKTVTIIKPKKEFIEQWIDLDENNCGVVMCEMEGDYRNINCEFVDFTAIRLTTLNSNYTIRLNKGLKFEMFCNDQRIINPNNTFKDMFKCFSNKIIFE